MMYFDGRWQLEFKLCPVQGTARKTHLRTNMGTELEARIEALRFVDRTRVQIQVENAPVTARRAA